MSLFANSGFKIASVYNRIAELGLDVSRNDTNGYTNSIKQKTTKVQLIRAVKRFRNLKRYTEYNESGNFIGNNGRITDEQFNKLLRDLIKVADLKTVPVSPKLLFRGVPNVINAGGQGPAGENGINAYVYVGYADDNTGTGFSTTPGSHTYLAVRQSTSPLTVVVGIFAGLWRKYVGDTGPAGATGTTGATGTIGATGAAGATGATGAAGINGYSILSGAGVPSSGLGVNGDFYIDLSSDPRLMYGPKTAGSWGSGYSIKGNIGDTGASGADGADGAAGTDGANAYLYTAYADDASGTGFTTTFDSSKQWVAFLESTVVIVSPVVGDFVGLWAKYRGTGDQWTTSSSTSLTIAIGTQTLIVEKDLAYSTGQATVISVPGDPTKRMEGVVDSYNQSTGQLTVSIDTIFGSGTYGSWSVSIQGAPGGGGGSSLIRLSVVTTTAPIVIDMNSLEEVMFVGSSNIGSAKTWSITNVGLALLIPSLKFTMTTLDIQTFPSNFKMSDARWDTVAHTWTPLDTGTYEFSLSYDGTEWLMTCLGGPYT